jgi:hypothetical protein
MHHLYFPPCPIEGPFLPPVPYSHFGSRGAVPQKCSTCGHLFEGGCTRAMDEVGRYLHLDYGPCDVNGPTDPVVYENMYLTGKVQVPRKCSTCPSLSVGMVYGFYCGRDKHIWGDFHRGLDWGTWEPDFVYMQLPFPKATTRKMIKLVHENNSIDFIKEYRQFNPRLSIQESRADFAQLRGRFSCLLNVDKT